MKNFLILLSLALALNVRANTACCPDGGLFEAASGETTKVALTEAQAKNLGLQTAEAAEERFEQTLFALGRIEAIPNKLAAVSSRIAGRVASLAVNPGDEVKAGQPLLRIESRQAGDPPPTITLSAPVDGTVCELDVRPGDPVEPEKRLMDIADLREVMAVAKVFEHQAGELKPGQKARIRIPAYPDKTFVGELQRVGTAVDREVGAIDAIFRIENTDLLLRPGMRAEFSIVTDARDNVLSVPREAILGDHGNHFVFMKDYEVPNVFVKTAVQPGALNDQQAEITGGLFPGDQVVTKGNFALQYSGAGGVSLKEAMDAAHGHSHGENGEELKAEDKMDHGHDEKATDRSSWWLPLLTGLVGLIIGSLMPWRKRHA